MPSGRFDGGRFRAQDQRKDEHRRAAEDAGADVGLAPADRVEGVLQDRRPDRAGEVVAARADRHRDAAPPVEPERGVGDERGEGGRAAEEPDQHPVQQAEFAEARGVAGEHEAAAQAERADDGRHHHAEAVGELAHQDAADAEADHGQRVGQRGTAARYAELGLHRRERHRDAVHARAAERHQRERRAEAQPGVGRFGLSALH
jgi:hypothetical protein